MTSVCHGIQHEWSLTISFCCLSLSRGFVLSDNVKSVGETLSVLFRDVILSSSVSPVFIKLDLH